MIASRPRHIVHDTRPARAALAHGPNRLVMAGQCLACSGPGLGAGSGRETGDHFCETCLADHTDLMRTQRPGSEAFGPLSIAFPRTVHPMSDFMSRTRLALVLVLALLPLGVPLARAAEAARDHAPAEAKGMSVTVVRPQRGTLTDTLLVTGSLQPREEIQVGSEVEGYRLEEILVEVGDRVQKGQVLARMSHDMLDVQLAQNAANAAKAKASIAQQRASLDQMLAQEAEANAALERSRQLNKTGVVAQGALDEKERAAKVATAQVAAARQALASADAEAAYVEAQRAELELRLQRTEVRSPEAGIVLSRDAHIGAVVLSTRAEPLFRIARDGAIDLEAEVPEAAMPRLALGQAALVTPAGFTQPVDGKVRLIRIRIDKSTRLGTVMIALPDDFVLRPGTYARAQVEISRREGLSVPQSAVLFDADGAYVLVVQDHVVRERRVETGLKSNGRIELTSGIGSDDLVVARAGGFLRDGDTIIPVEAAMTAQDGR